MNYYTQFSFTIVDTDDRLQALIEEIQAVAAENGLEPACDTQLEAQALHLSADEAGNVDLLAQAISRWQIKHAIDYAVGFEWASTADRTTDDAFGGGAAVIHRGAARWLNTGNWLAHQLHIRSAPVEPGVSVPPMAALAEQTYAIWIPGGTKLPMTLKQAIAMMQELDHEPNEFTAYYWEVREPSSFTWEADPVLLPTFRQAVDRALPGWSEAGLTFQQAAFIAQTSQLVLSTGIAIEEEEIDLDEAAD